MRIVFIRPHNYSPYYDPEIQEPLGLQYLAAHRRYYGDDVLLLDAAMRQVPELRLARRTVAFSPDIIAFSLTTAQELESLYKIYTECKRVLASRKVCWLAGGNYISSEPDNAASSLPADFTLIRFEGEKALDAFVRNMIASGMPLSKVRSRPTRENVIDGEPITDLDTLPFPDRPFADYVLNSHGTFNIQGSRGCCGTCRYCSSPGMSRTPSSRWRGRSASHIAEEIVLLEKVLGARCFNFIDEDFLGPPAKALERAHQLHEAFTARNLNISLGIQVRPATLSKEVIDLLLDIGVRYVFMGIESDDPEDFKRWGRPWTENPWQWVRFFQRHGVEVNAGVLLFHPHATFEGIGRFATKLHEHHLLDYRSAVNRLDAMPGSVFFKEALEQGIFARECTGPQNLPFLSPGMEDFYHHFRLVLDPLGPPTMHAVCALPSLSCSFYLDKKLGDTFKHLKQIITTCKDLVARSLFRLLSARGDGCDFASFSSVLRGENMVFAYKLVDELAAGGFVRSRDQLREAIRIDTRD